MSDSWILIFVTAFVIFLLFYMANRLICWGANSGRGRSDEDEEEKEYARRGINNYWDSEIEQNSPSVGVKAISGDLKPAGQTGGDEESQENLLLSRVENRLRSQIFHLLLAQKEYQQLEIDVWRLASILSSSQGVNPEECLATMKNEIEPLTAIANFQAQRRQCLRLVSYLNESSSCCNGSGVASSSNDPTPGTTTTTNQALQRSQTCETLVSNHNCSRCNNHLTQSDQAVPEEGNTSHSDQSTTDSTSTAPLPSSSSPDHAQE